ncbi:MAG: hypothetical protein JW801_03585 [Bacteroidales bacterium]|nr:hypothetical protein [Bacteroidales bacterium]
MDDKSKCPRCSNNAFEAINEKPVNSNYELIFVRCTSCKTVVGVVDYYNVGTLVKKLATQLKIDLDK